MLSSCYVQIEVALKTWYPFAQLPLSLPSTEDRQDDRTHRRLSSASVDPDDITHFSRIRSVISGICWIINAVVLSLYFLLIICVMVRAVPTVRKIHDLITEKHRRQQLMKTLADRDMTKLTSDPLLKLPEEVRHYILCTLELESVLTLSQLNRTYHSMIYLNDQLWRSLIKRDFGDLDRPVTRNDYQKASSYLHAYKSRYLIRLYFSRLHGGIKPTSVPTTVSEILVDECANSFAIMTQFCAWVFRSVLALVCVPIHSSLCLLFASDNVTSYQTSVQYIIIELCGRASDELSELNLFQDLWNSCTLEYGTVSNNGSWIVFCALTLLAFKMALIEFFACLFVGVQVCFMKAHGYTNDYVGKGNILKTLVCVVLDVTVGILLLSMQTVLLVYPYIANSAELNETSYFAALVQTAWILTAGVSYHELTSAYLKTTDRPRLYSMSTIICDIFEVIFWIPVYACVVGWFAMSRCLAYMRTVY